MGVEGCLHHPLPPTHHSLPSCLESIPLPPRQSPTHDQRVEQYAPVPTTCINVQSLVSLTWEALPTLTSGHTSIDGSLQQSLSCLFFLKFQSLSCDSVQTWCHLPNPTSNEWCIHLDMVPLNHNPLITYLGGRGRAFHFQLGLLWFTKKACMVGKCWANIALTLFIYQTNSHKNCGPFPRNSCMHACLTWFTLG